MNKQTNRMKKKTVLPVNEIKFYFRKDIALLTMPIIQNIFSGIMCMFLAGKTTAYIKQVAAPLLPSPINRTAQPYIQCIYIKIL